MITPNVFGKIESRIRNYFVSLQNELLDRNLITLEDLEMDVY